MGSNRAGEVTKRLDQDEYDSIALTDSLGSRILDKTSDKLSREDFCRYQKDTQTIA